MVQPYNTVSREERSVTGISQKLMSRRLANTVLFFLCKTKLIFFLVVFFFFCWWKLVGSYKIILWFFVVSRLSFREIENSRRGKIMNFNFFFFFWARIIYIYIKCMSETWAFQPTKQWKLSHFLVTTWLTESLDLLQLFFEFHYLFKFLFRFLCHIVSS